jgi:transposase InsO family protein
MNLHANRRTCPHSRLLLCGRVVEQGWKLAEAAEAAGCSVRTAAKWLARYRRGDCELLDRPSRPDRCPSRVPQQRVQAIAALRRVRITAAEIAEVLDLPLSTVSLWLKWIGLGKRSRLEPLEPPNRYERRHPGERVHVDIKQLGRISVRGAGHRVLGHRGSQYARRIDGRQTGITGFEYLHVMIDDHSRVAHAEVLDDLTAACAIAFLSRAVAWFAERGVRVQTVMSDNGSCYIAHAYAAALRQLRIKHLRIRPGRPRTNGKAEHLIQTMLNEWAYARIYGSSKERTAALAPYLTIAVGGAVVASGRLEAGLVRRPQLMSPSRGATLVVSAPSLVAIATEPCEDVGHRRLRVPFGFRLVRLSAACLEQLLIAARAASPKPISPSLSE